MENFGTDYIINLRIFVQTTGKTGQYGKTESMTEEDLNIKTLLEQILSGPEEALRAWKNGGIPVQLLRELFAHHDTFEVLYFLAGYAETPSKILEELGEKTQSVLILSQLADHPRTPKPLLQQLAKHEDPEVRKAVARSKWISPQSALILSDDENATVRDVGQTQQELCQGRLARAGPANKTHALTRRDIEVQVLKDMVIGARVLIAKGQILKGDGAFGHHKV